MDIGTCSEQQHNANSDSRHRKRKRDHKGVDNALIVRKRNSRHSIGINDLPDDVLIAILARMSRKEAARTSVLSRRWIYLWLFSSGTLEFDNRDMIPLNFNGRNLATRDEIMKKKFIARVNRVLKLHPGFDGLIIRYTNLLPHSRLSRRPGYIDSWIYFAMQKEVKMFELNLSTYGNIHPYYEFPDLDMLLSSSPDVKFGFGSLRSLRLVGVDIKDEVVHYFLASCPYLEHLCIRGSRHTKDLQVVDPLPNLKFLEISGYFIRRLKVSATNLVSCTYEGCKIISPFEKIPNLSELTLGGHFAQSFIYEPNEHSSYSVQLVKLALNIPRELVRCQPLSLRSLI